MERHTRVYPAQKPGGQWLSGLLLFLSAAVLFSGMLWRGKPPEVEIRPVATAAPAPLDGAFDETPVSEELALEGATWYALQFGAFEDAEAAEKLSAQYRQRGAAGYVWHDGRYRVLAALYPTREDAQNVRAQLQAQHGIDTWLYPIELPAMSLRISGKKGQLEMLQAAFSQSAQLVAGLEGLSVRLDRQEENSAEAAQTILSLAEPAEAVLLRLKQRFTPPRHAAVEGLIACLEHFSAFAAAADPSVSSAEMSALVKRQAFRTLDDLQSVYEGLSHT